MATTVELLERSLHNKMKSRANGELIKPLDTLRDLVSDGYGTPEQRDKIRRAIAVLHEHGVPILADYYVRAVQNEALRAAEQAVKHAVDNGIDYKKEKNYGY